jgi:thymidine kinase
MAKLYFYYSAMNAGKSTTLLQSSYNYIERGMQTLLFAPQIDQRFGRPTIYSRIGLKQEAIGFDQHLDIYESVSSFKTSDSKLKCVLIDEAHFLTKAQVKQLTKITTELNIPVLCYGLRSDFMGEPFPGSMYLLAWAEELIEIKTICHCGGKATMNLRVNSDGMPVDEGSQVQIGGNESYVSQCMKHFRASLPAFASYEDCTTKIESLT